MRTEKFNVIRQKFTGDLFPDYSTGLWYVYILTDTKRAAFISGICSNLKNFLHLMDETAKLAPRAGDPGPTRLVFLEGIQSHYAAGERLSEISCFTRLQKERAIRKSNPHWTDLSLQLRPPHTPAKNIQPTASIEELVISPLELRKTKQVYIKQKTRFIKRVLTANVQRLKNHRVLQRIQVQAY